MELPSLEPAYLWSNKRIFVFQLSTSPQTGKAYSDPSMLAVPPLDQWRSGYTLASVRTSNGAHDAILVLIAKSNCVSQISLRRSNQVTPILWSIAVGDYNISHTELQRGFYSVRSLGQGDCSVFGGYLYGPGNGLAWTMQIGQTFKDLPDVSISKRKRQSHIRIKKKQICTRKSRRIFKARFYFYLFYFIYLFIYLFYFLFILFYFFIFIFLFFFYFY